MQHYSEYDTSYEKSLRSKMVLQTAVIVIMIGLSLGLSMDYMNADPANTETGFTLVNVAHASR